MRSPDLPTRPQSRALFTLALNGSLLDTMPPISGSGEILTDYTPAHSNVREIVVIERDGGTYTLLPREHPVTLTVHAAQDARALTAAVEEVADTILAILDVPTPGCIVCRDASGIGCCEYGRAA